MGTISIKNKKNMPLKSILDHFKSLLTNLFTFLGGWVGRSDQALSQAAPYAHICYYNPTPIIANQHHTPTTSYTHCYHPPQLSKTDATHHQHLPLHHSPWWVAAVGYISSWWWWWVAAVDGSSGWQGEKTSEIFFVPNDLKSPKNNIFLFFFPHLGVGWVFQKQMWINPHFFKPFP